MMLRTVKLTESQHFRKIVLMMDDNSKGTRSYMEIGAEILNQNGTVESTLAKSLLIIAQHYYQ